MLAASAAPRRVTPRFDRAGMQPEVQRNLLTPTHLQGAFWREVHANFFDICVLDWCKLFADPRQGKHHWRRVDPHPGHFQVDLYTALDVSAAEFDDLITKVRVYRDRFVAHRDEERMAHLPMLELPSKAIAFLHDRLRTRSAQPPRLARSRSSHDCGTIGRWIYTGLSGGSKRLRR